MAKYSNERHLIWHDAKASLKVDIIRSLGSTLASTIYRSTPQGFHNAVYSAYRQSLKSVYGTVDQMTLNKMEDILANPLDNANNVEHLATMRQHMVMQTTALY